MQSQKKPEPLDLINTNEEEGLPLDQLQSPFVAGNWDVDKEKLSLVRPGENGEVTFEKELENGLKVVKRYRFHSEDEIIDIDVEVQNPTSKEVTLQLEFNGLERLIWLNWLMRKQRFRAQV